MSEATLTLAYSDTWLPQDPEPEAAVVDSIFSEATDTIDIDALYPSAPGIISPLGLALEHLKEAITDTEIAEELLVDRDLIRADDRMQLVHARLYELFAQRDIGDGFGAVINACLSGLENTLGESLRVDQIQTIRFCLWKLRQQPLIDFDASVVLVGKLEKCGLRVQPETMEAIADLLNG